MKNDNVDPDNYVEYFCYGCTARKRQGWKCCPFCGETRHYHRHRDGSRIHGEGLVRLHLKEAANPTSGETQNTQSISQGEKISSEEDQFNAAIKTVLSSFDLLKSCRKDRRKLEIQLEEMSTAHADTQLNLSNFKKQLPEGMQHCTIQFLECEKGHGRLHAKNWIDNGCLVCRVNGLEDLNARLRNTLDATKKPAPFAIRNIYGQTADSTLNHVLGILRIDQSYPFTDITVRLP